MFRPFYLLHGDEEYEREALVASMIEALVPAQTRDFNLDVLRAERLEVLDFFQVYETYSHDGREPTDCVARCRGPSG